MLDVTSSFSIFNCDNLRFPSITISCVSLPLQSSEFIQSLQLLSVGSEVLAALLECQSTMLRCCVEVVVYNSTRYQQKSRVLYSGDVKVFFYFYLHKPLFPTEIVKSQILYLLCCGTFFNIPFLETPVPGVPVCQFKQDPPTDFKRLNIHNTLFTRQNFPINLIPCEELGGTIGTWYHLGIPSWYHLGTKEMLQHTTPSKTHQTYPRD